MESKEDEVVVPITSLNRAIQEYVFLSSKIDAINAQIAELRARRKKIQPLVCEYLQNQPDNKQKLTIPPDAVATFGDGCVGLCLYTRKRTKDFNSKTFLQAMVDECVPLFQKVFKSNTKQDVIVDFAVLLAKSVWETRATTSSFEINTMLKTKIERKRAYNEAKKRKPDAKSKDDNPSQMSYLKTETSHEVSDDENAHF